MVKNPFQLQKRLKNDQKISIFLKFSNDLKWSCLSSHVYAKIIELSYLFRIKVIVILQRKYSYKKILIYKNTKYETIKICGGDGQTIITLFMLCT